MWGPNQERHSASNDFGKYGRNGWGVETCKAVYALATRRTSTAVYNVLYKGHDVREAIQRLMGREFKSEASRTPINPIGEPMTKVKQQRGVFLPATKTMAKEMLPIVDKPTIQYIVEETNGNWILIVTGRQRQSDHFDSNIGIRSQTKRRKTEVWELVPETTGINLYFVRQSKRFRRRGSSSESIRRCEHSWLCLGDDIMRDGIVPTKQLIENFEKTHASNIAVMGISWRKHIMGNDHVSRRWIV